MISELDTRRRGFLLNTISGQEYQALITAADMTGFDPAFLEKATLLEVRHGEVVSTEQLVEAAPLEPKRRSGKRKT